MPTYLFMRLDFASGVSIGPSRTAILEGIDRCGSLSAASRAVGLSYQQVWSTVKKLNRTFPSPLVTVRVGGPASGASLTPLGRALAQRFRNMERDANTQLKRHFRAFEKLLGENPRDPDPVPRWVKVLPPDAGRRPHSTGRASGAALRRTTAPRQRSTRR